MNQFGKRGFLGQSSGSATRWKIVNI
jgi:hypothetical protein